PAAEEAVAPAHRRPRPAVRRPADHLRLLVAVPVEQHRVTAGARSFHQDDGRPALEAHDVERQALDPPLPRPLGDERYGALDVAVLRPLGVEHGRLGRDADVLGERGDDVAVPGALDEVEGAVVVGARGLIQDIDEPVAASASDDDFTSEHNRAITWRDLLTQTSEWQGTLWGKPDSIDHNRDIGKSELGRAQKGQPRPLQKPGT